MVFGKVDAVAGEGFVVIIGATLSFRNVSKPTNIQ
jgi:hypothetical protein